MSHWPGLERKRDAIAEAWCRVILETYPAEAAKLFLAQRDRFKNPVGANVSEAAGAILDGLLGAADREELAGLLDGLVRLRAVQDFTASEAVGVLLRLKELAAREDVDPAELVAFGRRVDEALLVAFDVFVSCRERIYDLRAKDAWNRSFKLLQRAGFVAEIPEGRDTLVDLDHPNDPRAKRGADR